MAQSKDNGRWLSTCQHYYGLRLKFDGRRQKTGEFSCRRQRYCRGIRESRFIEWVLNSDSRTIRFHVHLGERTGFQASVIVATSNHAKSDQCQVVFLKLWRHQQQIHPVGKRARDLKSTPFTRNEGNITAQTIGMSLFNNIQFGDRGGLLLDRRSQQNRWKWKKLVRSCIKGSFWPTWDWSKMEKEMGFYLSACWMRDKRVQLPYAGRITAWIGYIRLLDVAN
jgi:hypothetical protein